MNYYDACIDFYSDNAIIILVLIGVSCTGKHPVCHENNIIRKGRLIYSLF